MFVSSQRSSGFFCLFFYFSLVVNSSIGQLVDDISVAKNNGQQNPKINSIKKNSLVASDSVEPAAGSDSLELSKKFAFLNKNIETQSAGTSSGTLTPSARKSTGYLTSTVASVVIGAKKCEYF